MKKIQQNLNDMSSYCKTPSNDMNLHVYKLKTYINNIYDTSWYSHTVNNHIYLPKKLALQSKLDMIQSFDHARFNLSI